MTIQALNVKGLKNEFSCLGCHWLNHHQKCINALFGGKPEIYNQKCLNYFKRKN